MITRIFEPIRAYIKEKFPIKIAVIGADKKLHAEAISEFVPKVT
ncbi:hypothetical protein [Leptospira santarosai]|nr:hypothetical protein [Leptospira santarosai]